MPWIFFAVVSILTVSIAALLERALMKDEDSNPIGYAIVFQFLLAAISLLFTVVFNKLTLPTLSAETIIRFIISAFLWAGTTALTFYAIKKLTAGEVTVLTASSSVVSITLGIIFLSEIIKLPTVIGSVLVLLAIWIINSGKLGFKSKEGVTFALLSALCAGIAVVNDAVILKSYEAFSYTTIMSFLPGIVLLAVFPKKLKGIGRLLRTKKLGLMLVFCLFYSIQAITYYLAFQKGAPVSQLSPLTKSSIVLTVILAAIFLNEREDLLKKVIAAVVVTIGSILLG